jgi:hypothetical protein
MHRLQVLGLWPDCSAMHCARGSVPRTLLGELGQQLLQEVLSGALIWVQF